ncbi:MAG: hypothetical protein NTW30_04790 [Candidatus Aenigmarchaeota archaeon]|nr:hypothetical protein [Candidatus Aenigmarchaeota archaeon]
MSASYDFPVSLQPVYTKEGNPVPKIQAVVRDDTGEALSAVSNRYLLVPHKNVIDQAQEFISAFGNPVSHFHTNNNGSTLIGEFLYEDKTLKVAKGDTVGLKVYIENSYNRSRSVTIRIGALVLSCLNGMVSSRPVAGMTFKHIIGAPQLAFPKASDVIDMFQFEAGKWRSFGEIIVDRTMKQLLMEDIEKKSVMPQDGLRALSEIHVDTAWDLLQGMTYFTTHQNSKLSNIGKINRLQKISRWMDEQFVQQSET